MKIESNRTYTGCALDEIAPTAAEVIADRLMWFALGATFLYLISGLVEVIA